MAYTAKIKGSIVISDELSVLSKVYCRIRDESGEGCSTFPTVNVKDGNGKTIGSISYNGRIWDRPRGSYQSPLTDSKLLYDNRVEA